VVADAFNAMTSELETVVSGLRELDELRIGHVGSIAHELRNPLTSVVGHLDEVAEGELGEVNAEQQEALGVALRNARRLGRLIDDLLLLSRLEAGRVDLRQEPVELAALAGEVAADLRPSAEPRGIAVALVPAAPGRVHGDPDRLRQCVVNLVSNAVKFSPEQAAVEVEVHESPEAAQLFVRDRGVGIPEAELARIGERFFRASTAAGVHGTGLGLAVTRELVERHGGRLEARARDGGGTEFRMTLPRAAGQAGATNR
jgi:signal transduction histidine kinase